MILIKIIRFKYQKYRTHIIVIKRTIKNKLISFLDRSIRKLRDFIEFLKCSDFTYMSDLLLRLLDWVLLFYDSR